MLTDIDTALDIKSVRIIDYATSTNDFLKALTKEQMQEEGFAVYTPNQTAGRGQRGNMWESEAGKNIALSMVFYPDFLPVSRSFLLSETVALGVKDALETAGIRPTEIKFPNDIYYDNRKAGGILIENEITGGVIASSIAGIGLNVNQDVFLSDAPNPVSMKQILGRDMNISLLLQDIISSIRQRYSLLKTGDTEVITRDYHDAAYRKSGFFQYRDANGCFTAEIVRISDDGLLHLRTDRGQERAYAFKEVSFI
jgi:BirA family biotin operon repressor/biotin-[acetyl-CoA-carboxylase] ligase